VTVIDSHGCTDSAQVVLDDPLPVQYDIDPQDPLCFGDSTGHIDLLVTGGTVFSVDDYEIRINDVVSGPYTGNLPEGSYHISVEDLNDCAVETDVDLLDPPLLELSYDTEEAFCKYKPDGEINISVNGGTLPYDVTWEGLPDNEYSFNDRLPGTYRVTITDDHMCELIGTITVGFVHEGCLVYPNAFSPNGDGINDQWMIENLELYSYPVELRIFDRWGTLVFYTRNAVDEHWDGTFNGRRLPIDSYHFIISLRDEEAITGNVTIVR
jgi:gliding motility-associated-like protein